MTDEKECDCCGGMWGYINNDGEHDCVWDCVTELTKQRDEARRERDEARTVTDAMVERAAKAWYQHATPYFWLLASQDTKRSFLSTARAALTAALTHEAP
jgi:hypothetical protein